MKLLPPYAPAAGRKSPTIVVAATPVRRLRMLAYLLLGCFLSYVAFSQPPAKRPLTVGIERNQQELQRIAGMIDENKKEQAWTLTEGLADATSVVTAGALKNVERASKLLEGIKDAAALKSLDDAKRASKLLDFIKNAAGTTGKLTDFADAIDDFKDSEDRPVAACHYVCCLHRVPVIMRLPRDQPRRRIRFCQL